MVAAIHPAPLSEATNRRTGRCGDVRGRASGKVIEGCGTIHQTGSSPDVWSGGDLREVRTNQETGRVV
jgi:hypothetical protein